MTSLRCHEWDIHQSYRRDRNPPPWIKVHRNLMQNRKWARLTDAEKGQLVSIWVLAADRDGCIPDDPYLVKKICMLDAEPNLEKFIGLGLLIPTGRQRDVNVTSTRRQSDAPEAESEEISDKKTSESEKKNTLGDKSPFADEEFERLWLKRPRRAGNDPKNRALSAFRARLKNGTTVADIEAGMERYARFCEATGKLDTETVMQFATFCGPDEPFRQSWRIPRQGAALSHSNDDAIARAMGEH